MNLTPDQKKYLSEKTLSYSSLKAFKQSPQHYVQYCFAPMEPTPAMLLGSIFDCLVLTPGEFGNKFFLIPKIDKRTIKGKEEYEYILIKIMERNEALAKEKKPPLLEITQQQLDTAKEMKESLFSNKEAAPFVRELQSPQKTIFWQDKATGLKFKGVLDEDHAEYILDLKKVASGKPEKFMRAAIDFDYPLQAAMYRLGKGDLFNGKPFIYVCVESSEPYAVSVFKADNDFIRYGFNEYNRLKQQFKFCAENDLWHMSYDFHSALGYYNLSIPNYLKNDL